MKPIVKLYLKTFLLTGITYGLIMTAFDLAEGESFSLGKFLSLTIFFGATMSIILVTFHKYQLKKNGVQEITDENLGASQTKTIKSRLTKVELIAKLKNDPIIGKMNFQELEDGISIKSGFNWKSWGEKIIIKINSTIDSEYEYQITSSPRLKTTLIDYRKNLENITRVENALINVA